MKKIITLLVVLMTAVAFAQAPQKMSYQAVLRNANNTLITNTTVGMRISFLQGSATGTAVYVETQTPTTNANGLVAIEIGGGTIVSGSFATIDWSKGPYFIKTETAPTGGTNYSITGTSQLLSTPYALYAENTRNLGKTTIRLTGDITNEEAAAIIAERAGPNTENIYIEGTTQLTSLDLSSVTLLDELNVSNNTNLTTLDLSSVTSSNNIRFTDNTNLTSLNLNKLKTFYGDFNVSNNSKLSTLVLPSLTSMGSASSFNVSNNDLLTSVDLSTVTSSSIINIINNTNLTSVKLNQLKTCSSSISMSGNPKLSELLFPSLTSINSTSNNSFSISGNNSLTTISFPVLNNCGTSILLNNNKLSSEVVNNILHTMLNCKPVSGKNIDLKYQYPKAMPTGQGLTDVAILINNGNTVRYDGDNDGELIMAEGNTDTSITIYAKDVSGNQINTLVNLTSTSANMRRVYITRNVAGRGEEPFILTGNGIINNGDGSVNIDATKSFKLELNVPKNTALTNGTEVYKIWATTGKGDYRDTFNSFVVGIGTVTINYGNGINPQTPVKSFTNKILAAPLANGSSQNLISSIDGKTYAASQGSEYSAFWDFDYYYGANDHASFTSIYNFPTSIFDISAISGTPTAELNKCYFKLSTITSSQFDEIAVASDLNSITNSFTQIITNLSTGNIIEFVNIYGKKGLIRVVEVKGTWGSSDYIKIDVKVQP